MATYNIYGIGAALVDTEVEVSDAFLASAHIDKGVMTLVDEARQTELLEQQPDLTQRQLAEQLGVSLGKTHYLVKSLIDVGWVKIGNFQRSDNKWGYAYLLTPMGIVEKAAITARFLVRKQREYTQLQQEITELQEEMRQQQDLNKK